MSGVLDIDGSVVLEANLAADTRFVFNEGSSRSTKTVSIAKKHIIHAFNGLKERVTICREKATWMRDTVMVDFFDILSDHNLYRRSDHNKTERSYTLNGTEFQFIGLDEKKKLMGRKQHRVWVNEADGAEYESVRHLNLRTSKQITFDYNPTIGSGLHWIDTQFLDNARRKAQITFIHSTFRDNPFLDPDIRQEIEMLEHEDEVAWKIYGLGIRAASRALIFTIHVVDDSAYTTPDCYGLDFGFNHPTVLTGVQFKEMTATCKELVYQSYLTTPDLIQLMDQATIDKYVPIYADHSRPETIEEIKRAGYNILPANKSVKEGITTTKAYRLNYTASSAKSIKQCRNYKYKQVGEIVMDEPVKFEDDAPDSVRYAIHTHAQKGEITPARIHIIRRHKR